MDTTKRGSLLRTIHSLEITLATLRASVIKECESCEYWSGGCERADGRVPPPQVMAGGCELWSEGVPF